MVGMLISSDHYHDYSARCGSKLQTDPARQRTLEEPCHHRLHHRRRHGNGHRLRHGPLLAADTVDAAQTRLPMR